MSIRRRLLSGTIFEESSAVNNVRQVVGVLRGFSIVR